MDNPNRRSAEIFSVTVGFDPQDTENFRKAYLVQLAMKFFCVASNLSEVSTLPENVVFLFDPKIRLKAGGTLSTEAQR